MEKQKPQEREAEPQQAKEYEPTRYSDTLYGCGKCGQEIRKGDRSCPRCGTQIRWK